MTPQEIIDAVSDCFFPGYTLVVSLTSMEHKTREWFLYRDKAIYNPHQDVDKLLSITEER